MPAEAPEGLCWRHFVERFFRRCKIVLPHMNLAGSVRLGHLFAGRWQGVRMRARAPCTPGEAHRDAARLVRACRLGAAVDLRSGQPATDCHFAHALVVFDCKAAGVRPPRWTPRCLGH